MAPIKIRMGLLGMSLRIVTVWDQLFFQFYLKGSVKSNF